MKSSNTPKLRNATIIGQLSLIFWALAVCYIVGLKNIPTFEILSIVYMFGFLMCILVNTYLKRWKYILDHPKYIFIIGILAIFGNDVLYIGAFKYAPAIHVELIIYLWPIMVLISSRIFLKEKLHLTQLIACIIALYGIYIALTSGKGVTGFETQYLLGYLCTFFSAVIWTAYIIISKIYKKMMPEMFSIFCGFGFVFSTILHFNYEITVIPSISQWWLLFIMGITTHSIAYFCWDYAIKNGNFNLLSVLSYGNPIISIFSLVALKISKLSISVIIATLLVSFAAMIAGSKKCKLFFRI